MKGAWSKPTIIVNTALSHGQSKNPWLHFCSTVRRGTGDSDETALIYALLRKHMLKFLRKTALWIVLIPGAVWAGGVASNQAVLIANHDRFPVMWNDYKVNHYTKKLEKTTHSDDKDAAQQAEFDLEALQNGYLDDVHCLMTSETHLNFLSDVFDAHGSGTYSIGDLMIAAGEWAFSFVSFVWVLEAIRRLRRLNDDSIN